MFQRYSGVTLCCAPSGSQVKTISKDHLCAWKNQVMSVPCLGNILIINKTNNDVYKRVFK